ncbi:MAG: sterol desaturase family protein [Bacteroidota bacterium]
MEDILTRVENNIGLVIAIIFLFSLGLALLEFFVELYQKKINKWRLGEMWASLSVFIPAQLTEKAANAIFLGSFFLIDRIIPWQIPVNAWTTILAVLLIDFLYYWEHRWEHEIRALWSYHSIHHSSPIYNYTTALRVSFIDNFVTWIFYLPAIIIGFHPLVVLLAISLTLIYQFWIHTELIGKMGWYGWIFNTPSHHRVHHGSDELYLDKNYGAILIIWDRMFGTFQQEEFKPTYGLTTQIDTINPVKVHFHEYITMFRDIRKARSFREAINYLIKPPGWEPQQQQSET